MELEKGKSKMICIFMGHVKIIGVYINKYTHNYVSIHIIDKEVVFIKA